MSYNGYWGILKRFSCMKCYFFYNFFMSFKHDFHVDVHAESMIIRTQELPIISANIFDFTARTFFPREDLLIFIYKMINYSGSTQPMFFTIVATNSESWAAPVVGFCSCSVFCCVLLCVHSAFAIILFEMEGLVALVSLSSCVSWLVCCSSSRYHGFVCSL